MTSEQKQAYIVFFKKLVDSNDLLEKLAELEHKQWETWTQYMLDHDTIVNRMRWQRQSLTDYRELSEEDKEKDRIWARKILQVLAQVATYVEST